MSQSEVESDSVGDQEESRRATGFGEGVDPLPQSAGNHVSVGVLEPSGVTRGREDVFLRELDGQFVPKHGSVQSPHRGGSGGRAGSQYSG